MPGSGNEGRNGHHIEPQQLRKLPTRPLARPAEVTEAHESAGRAEQRATEAIAVERQQYPAKLQFVYGAPKYEKPFLVRAMWHDGQFTYVKADAPELPALYEVTDGKPALLNFQVRGQGTYVVPKVLEREYLALGNARFSFEQRER